MLNGNPLGPKLMNLVTEKSKILARCQRYHNKAQFFFVEGSDDI